MAQDRVDVVRDEVYQGCIRIYRDNKDDIREVMLEYTVPDWQNKRSIPRVVGETVTAQLEEVIR